MTDNRKYFIENRLAKKTGSYFDCGNARSVSGRNSACQSVQNRGKSTGADSCYSMVGNFISEILFLAASDRG